jgi:biotin carboxyl carrier protein
MHPPGFLKRRLLWPLLILAGSIGGFVALKMTRPVQPLVPVSERIWRVDVVTVRHGPAAPMLNLSGRVESPEQTRLAAASSARVLRVKVREGDKVAAGEVLVELDPRDIAPRVAQAQGAVDEIKAAMASEQLRHRADLDQVAAEQRLLQLAREDVARFQRLRREGFYSQAAVDQGSANQARQEMALRSRELAIAEHAARLAQLQARLDRAEADLAQARLAETRSRVVAPFAGVVAKVEVAAGDQVGINQALLSLYPWSALEIRAKIPAPYQDEFMRLGAARGDAVLADVRLPVRLLRLSGAADARGLDAFFAVQQGADRLRVGSLVALDVARATVQDAVLLPYDALYSGRTVYRIRENRLQAVAVTVMGEQPAAQAGAQPLLVVRAPELAEGAVVLRTHLPNAVSGLRVEVMEQK